MKPNRLGTKKLSRPCAISASRSTTRLRSPRKPTSEKQRVAVSYDREHGPPSAFLARPRPTGALRPAPQGSVGPRAKRELRRRHRALML